MALIPPKLGWDMNCIKAITYMVQINQHPVGVPIVSMILLTIFLMSLILFQPSFDFGTLVHYNDDLLYYNAFPSPQYCHFYS